LGEDVVSQQQVGSLTLLGHCHGQLHSEEFCDGRDALSNSYLGNIFGWFDAQGWYALFNKVLQQVAVIARKLDHLVIFTELESFNHLARVIVAMLQP
jgi:hypothetical protein